MADATAIKHDMPVICSQGGQFGTVDDVEGNSIKLTKEGSQDHQHHWIPLDWVTRVDQHVHIDRPGDQAMREWSNTPPQSAQSGASAS